MDVKFIISGIIIPTLIIIGGIVSAFTEIKFYKKHSNLFYCVVEVTTIILMIVCVCFVSYHSYWIPYLSM